MLCIDETLSEIIKVLTEHELWLLQKERLELQEGISGRMAKIKAGLDTVRWRLPIYLKGKNLLQRHVDIFVNHSREMEKVVRGLDPSGIVSIDTNDTLEDAEFLFQWIKAVMV